MDWRLGPERARKKIPKAGSGCVREKIPKGFRLRAQGCEGRATLGMPERVFQPQRGCAKDLRDERVRFAMVPKGVPRVARSSQPWALRRNPVGVEGVGVAGFPG